MKGPRIRIAVVVILAAALAVTAGLRIQKSRNNPTISLLMAPVRRGDLISSISATGTIEPLEVVDVGAQVAGRVSAFGHDKDGNNVDYGSAVEQGALLANIDDSVYAADFAVAKARELSASANVEQMNARLDQAEAEWKRTEELFKNRLISQGDYDTAKANYKAAKANVSVADSGVAQAKADLEKARRNLDFCTINCPVSGVIIDRRVNVGQTVVASLNAPSLFLIAKDLTKMQIWVAVNEADVGRIKPRAPVTFTVDAFPGREFRGVVGKVRLNATMAQNVVLYTIEINIDNPGRLLLPYLTANVRFILSHESDTLLVPNSALRWTPSSPLQILPEARSDKFDEGQSTAPSAKQENGSGASRRTVWLRDGAFVRPVEVTTGASDGANTAIAANGLPEGAEVVIGESGASGQTDVKNPFLPKVIRR